MLLIEPHEIVFLKDTNQIAVRDLEEKTKYIGDKNIPKEIKMAPVSKKIAISVSFVEKHFIEIINKIINKAKNKMI